MIACIVVPYFAAAVERRDDRTLAQTPLVIGGRGWEPRPVYAYSREARQQGIRPGMLLRQAQVVAPASHFLPADGSGYRQAAAEVGAVLLDFTPFMEPEDAWHPPAEAQRPFPIPNLALPARYYLDWEDLPVKETIPLTRHLGQTLRQAAGLEAAIGLAESRFAAQLAAAYTQPGRIRPVTRDNPADFLAPYPLNCLPLPAEMGRRLHLLGIHTLGQLAALPLPALQAQFGREIGPFHRLAQGQADGAIAAQEAEPVETAVSHFEPPVASRETLTAVLTHLAQDLAGRLHTAVQVGGVLRLTWDMESGDTIVQTQALRQPTADPGHLAACLHDLLAQADVTEGVTAVAVTVAGLTPARAYQLALFDQKPAAGGKSLHQLVARLQAKFAQAAFYETAVIAPEHPLLEQRAAWRALAYDPLLA